MLNKLIKFLPKNKIRYFAFIIFISIIVGIIETLSVAALIPLLGIIANTELININKYHKIAFELIGNESAKFYIIFLSVFTLLFYIIRGVVGFYYNKLISIFSFSI